MSGIFMLIKSVIWENPVILTAVYYLFFLRGQKSDHFVVRSQMALLDNLTSDRKF